MHSKMPVATNGARARAIDTPGIPGFLEWVKTRQPYLYRPAEKRLKAQGLAGLGVVDLAPVTVDTSLVSSPDVSSSSSGGIVDTLSSLLLGAGQAYLTKQQIDAQKKILNLQLDRAKQGLPPLDLDPAQYGLPGPNVKVGLDADTKKWLTIGGGILGAGVLALIVFGGSGRRARGARA